MHNMPATESRRRRKEEDNYSFPLYARCSIHVLVRKKMEIFKISFCD